MWSDRKPVNCIVNILLFLMAVNFMHIGQLFLPLICLILFVDKGFRFHLKNVKVFVLLCLFAVSYCAFSYRLGLYCFVSFCFPMAYYIGSNLNKSKENIINLIYLIAFGMAMHMVLNFFLELSIWHDNLSYMFNKESHYDIWLWRKVNSTAMSLNGVMLISCIYYLLFFEENRLKKNTGIILFLLISIYNMALGRRTAFFIMIISFALSILLDKLVFTGFRPSRQSKMSLIIISVMLVLFIAAAKYNVMNLTDLLKKISIFRRLIEKGLYSGRLEILFQSIKNMPYHLWGGQEISRIVGIQPHDLLCDIYDYAGIVPFILMICFLCMYLIEYTTTIKNIDDKKHKLLVICLFVCSSLIYFLEPLITGASIYFICTILLYAAIN